MPWSFSPCWRPPGPSRSRQPPRSKLSAQQTSWSPDGRWIAHLRPRQFDPGRYDLVLIAPDGSAERLLGPGGAAEWSPNGRRILVYSSEQGSSKYRVVDLASGVVRPFDNAYIFGGLDWSPDSERIAYTHWGLESQPLFVSRWDGTGRRQLVERADRPEWSPDGDEIVYAQYGTCLGEGPIEVIRTDGTGHRVIGRVGERRYAPRWSPTGDALAFSASRVGCDLRGDLFYVVGRDGQGERLVGEGFSDQELSWSPTGGWLAVMDWNAYTTLLLMQVDGSREARFSDLEAVLQLGSGRRACRIPS